MKKSLDKIPQIKDSLLCRWIQLSYHEREICAEGRQVLEHMIEISPKSCLCLLRVYSGLRFIILDFS